MCNKLGCGKVVMARIDQKIPQLNANSEDTYEKMSAMKQHGCGLAIPAVLCVKMQRELGMCIL